MQNPHARMKETVAARLERVMTDEGAIRAIERVYEWFHELATGKSTALKELHTRFDFVSIVGIPRNGGSYLTAELFSALGYDPDTVPAAVAHDGMPEARPFSFSNNNNTWIGTLLSMSEYLTMVEIYFANRSQSGKVVVPKKLTKGVYAGSFFNGIFGRSAEYYVTVRHPIACCISTYEKSGGLPSDGRFVSRSNIEKWIKRDVFQAAATSSGFKKSDYFSAYVRYWELFHINLACSGLLSGRVHAIVPFGKESMETTAATFHQRFGSTNSAGEFVVSRELEKRHPDWSERSQLALERVDTVWRMVGLDFPKTQLLDCY
jgi:hypothetical protein